MFFFKQFCARATLAGAMLAAASASAQEIKTVSYTHLTLPTNREV